MRGTILRRKNVLKGTVGAIVVFSGVKILSYIGAVIYGPTKTIPLNLAGLSYFIEDGGDLIWYQVPGEELWWEIDVQSLLPPLKKGFTGSFSRTKMEPRMNVPVENWRRIEKPNPVPFVRPSEAEKVLVLDEMTEEEFKRRHWNIPISEQMTLL